MSEKGLYSELEYLKKRVEYLDEVNRFAGMPWKWLHPWGFSAKHQ